MTRFWRLIATASLSLSVALVQGDGPAHAHETGPAAASRYPNIVVMINPEARISAALTGGGGLLPLTICGTATELSVKIVNQAGVTMPLIATLADPAPEGASIEFPDAPLTGKSEEHRVLRLVLRKPGYVDITVTFRAKHNIPDLGLRDRIHFLLTCR